MRASKGQTHRSGRAASTKGGSHQPDSPAGRGRALEVKEGGHTSQIHRWPRASTAGRDLQLFDSSTSTRQLDYIKTGCGWWEQYLEPFHSCISAGIFFVPLPCIAAGNTFSSSLLDASLRGHHGAMEHLLLLVQRHSGYSSSQASAFT